MVYCGKPSKACEECRIRRTKVSLDRHSAIDLQGVVEALPVSNLHSAIHLGRHVLNAFVPGVYAEGIEIQQI
jgi:hypothetical protein